MILGIIGGVIGFVLGLFMPSESVQAVSSLVGIVIGVAYFVYFWTTTGATPGKSAMNIRVVSTDGETISAGVAILRYIGYAISAVVLLLGFIWIAIDEDKQGWHDKIAGTYVIKS